MFNSVLFYRRSSLHLLYDDHEDEDAETYTSGEENRAANFHYFVDVLTRLPIQIF
jgi:hypothetical protein